MEGLQGSILQMINHGLSTGALFLLVGIIYERTHTRIIANYGGLSSVMPLFTAVFIILIFSSIGVPGLNGFVGELLIMIGAYKANIYFAGIATLGLFLGPIYLFWLFERMMLGKVTKEENRKIPDMNMREIAYMVPLIIFMIWIGLNPRPFIKTTEASVAHLLEQVQVEDAVHGVKFAKRKEIQKERPEIAALDAHTENQEDSWK